MDAIVLESVSKRFGDAVALNALSASVREGTIAGVVGPDGAGKTTLLRLMAGLLAPTDGTVSVLGRDPRSPSFKEAGIVGYMPQRFGLYEDLTVMENLRLYARLGGLEGPERRQAFERLLEFTGLAPFGDRLAGRLSGGMKQKLGLACALLRRPRVLLLDEPSVGVDPVSRRQLWEMVHQLVREGMTVVWSTSYLDEAERCDSVLVLDEGKVVFQGEPGSLAETVGGRVFLLEPSEEEKRSIAVEALAREDVVDAVVQGSRVRIVMRRGEDAGTLPHTPVPARPRLEDGILDTLGGLPKERVEMARRMKGSGGEGTLVQAQNLTRRFGTFVAVDSVSFEVRAGEVFGILGPNGAGKTTTFKMVCGLLTPTSGRATVAGVDLASAPSKARQNIGYMAQRFSLYGDLSVRQNLEFFGGLYGLSGRRLRQAVDEALHSFQLERYSSTPAGQLPLGFKQRLSMACATLHGPNVLFLDEPTSGVDPITRREFWIRINTLVSQGTAVVVTTHFMDEAEYCDRLALMHRGRIVALDTPDAIKAMASDDTNPDPTLEEAFIRLVRSLEAEG